MESMLAVVLVLIVATAAALFQMFRRLMNGPDSEGLDLERIERFTVSRYRPMERLLSQTDHEFLRKQAGYHPSMERRLRIERSRILRTYLDNLSADFYVIHGSIRLLLAHAPSDQPELARALVAAGFRFRLSLTLIRLRLLLYEWNLANPDLSMLDLLKSTEQMRLRLAAIRVPAG